ncbi:MAG: hypothetical protein KDC98_13175 [Planctomycetes bacterium]|nr:hypothetical protein [Planctomycetota bacterium]
MAAFGLLLSIVLAVAAWDRFAEPGLTEAVRQLADGDLDGDERRRVLAALVRGGASSPDPGPQWIGLLAAVALEDREAHRLASLRLGGRDAIQLPEGMRPEYFDLGDPLLGNFDLATRAEAAGERDRARVLWRQVAAQSRLVPNRLAAELAAAAIERLR